MLERPVVDVDAEVAGRFGAAIPQIFEAEGEESFRRVEAHVLGDALGRSQPSIVDAGGGAVTFDDSRTLLQAGAFTVLVDVDADLAWERARGGDRPLARDEEGFRRLYAERLPLYRQVAGASVRWGDVDGAVLAAGGVHHEPGALDRLGELVPGDGPVALVCDARVAGIHGRRAQEALGSRLAQTIDVPAGEDAKRVDVAWRLWGELRLDRRGTIVALGGGTTTDLAGFVAATYLRGVAWVPVPTTLVGQVDAAIGGKTAVDLPQGKNLVGAFHWPARVVLDETLLETLPNRERRQGRAELVKTELLAGRHLDIRAAAAFKTALCLRDPQDRGPRNILNLGHTFAHALEAAADFDLPHGEAVALGLLAALRLSGRDTKVVERELRPEPIRVDLDRAWQALLRDKKRTGDAVNVVVLTENGPELQPRDAADVRRELARLIA